jgi:hypothetical protein
LINHMMKKAFVLMMFVMLSAVVLATPGIPNRFFGAVTINGGAAPDGTVVSVRISGIQVASGVTSGGKYGYNPPGPIFYVTDPDNDRQGKTLSFFVNGVDSGQTAIFVNGASTQLNLAATVAAPPSGGGGGNGGGGGGGTGVTGLATTPKNNTNNTNTTTQQNPVTQQTGPCTERWLCTDWSACDYNSENNTQARTCEDVNKCGATKYKPIEIQPCVVEKQTSNPLGANYDFLTAFAVAEPTVKAEIGIFVVALIFVVYVLWRKMKKPKDNK